MTLLQELSLKLSFFYFVFSRPTIYNIIFFHRISYPSIDFTFSFKDHNIRQLLIFVLARQPTKLSPWRCQSRVPTLLKRVSTNIWKFLSTCRPSRSPSARCPATSFARPETNFLRGSRIFRKTGPTCPEVECCGWRASRCRTSPTEKRIK